MNAIARLWTWIRRPSPLREVQELAAALDRERDVMLADIERQLAARGASRKEQS